MTVITERRDRVWVVTIDRPPVRNAIDRATAGALAEAFRDFDRDDTLDLAVLTGAGGHFCAGADLKAVATGNGPRVAVGGDGPLGPTRMQLTKPVIAAIEGYAVAGGLELALWCDLRIAAEGAVLGVFCRRFGVPLVDGGTVRLPRLIGHSRAMDLLLTGRPVTAGEAAEIGLVNRVVADGEARERAVALAGEITQFPQACLRNDRASAIEQWGTSEAAGMRIELAHGQDTLASGETASGAHAFTQGAGRHGRFGDGGAV